MFTTAELFGRFHSPKAPLASARRSLDDAAPQELERLFGPCLPAGLLSQAEAGPNSRERVYSRRVTFWTFLYQVLNPGSSCRNAVRKVMAWFALLGRPEVSEDDSPYCQARRRLDRDTLQRAFPQSARQKPGCGFPLVRWVALFSLATGALLEVAIGNKHTSELKLLRRIWEALKEGMILLADRGFCDFVTLAALFLRGVDSVMRLNASRDHDFRKGKPLGKGDRLVVWRKPEHRTRTATQMLWRRLPDQITLRLISWPVSVPGFRTQKLILVTTLLDPVAYPPAELAALYLRRWRVELFLRDIKITLGIDHLACKSPPMLYRELMMHLIGYNLVRCLMVEAANLYEVELERISFKGSVDTLHHFSLVMAAARSGKQRIHLTRAMLEALARDLLPHRPNRVEPRSCKRRRKAYPFMVKPRAELRARILRGKKCKNQRS